MLMTALADKLTRKLPNAETVDTGDIESMGHIGDVYRRVCVNGNTTQQLTS
jgi:hypothetical protein